MNAAINRINRQGYVLARLQKLLDERSISLTRLTRTRPHGKTPTSSGPSPMPSMTPTR